MQRYLPLAGLCLAVFLAMTGMGMAGVALPEKYLQSSGTMQSAGWLASVFALSYMACQYPAGRLADSFGYRSVLAFGFLLMAGAAVIYSVGQSTTAIYLGRFLQGAGEAPVWASAPAYLGQRYPAMRGRAMGLYNAAFHFGLMIGPIASTWNTGTIQYDPFAVFAWCCAAAMLLVMAMIGVHPTHAEARIHSPGVLAMLTRCHWPVLYGLPFFGAAYGLLTSSFPVSLISQGGYSQKSLGLFLFCVYLGIAISQCLVGRLSDRFGRKPFIAGGIVCMNVGLWGFVSADHTAILPFATFLGLGLGTFAVASMALANESVPDDQKATISGLYYLAWGCGYFAGPLLVNAVGLRFGVTSLVACLCCVLTCVCLQTKPPRKS